MNNLTKQALSALFEQQTPLWQHYDEQWSSPCQFGEVVDDKITWQPVKREGVDLSNIEQALEITLHPSIHGFFSHFYAGELRCLYKEHPIELIQPWNDDDFKMLQENMLAHFLMQKRLGQPASMFIATCSDEMQIISVVNETGEVQLETLGKGQEQLLSVDLPTFLAQLTVIKEQ